MTNKISPFTGKPYETCMGYKMYWVDEYPVLHYEEMVRKWRKELWSIDDAIRKVDYDIMTIQKEFPDVWILGVPKELWRRAK